MWPFRAENQTMPKPLSLSFPFLAALALGCAGSSEKSVRQDLEAYPGRDRRVTEDEQGRTESRGNPKLRAEAASAGRQVDESGYGTLSHYLARALEKNPEARAAFARWRASVSRIARSRTLPEPTLSFGYFIQSVETRVGPQQARVGLQQSFPWPTKLTAGADSAAAQAQAQARAFDARVLAVQERVARAYWQLWQVRISRAIHEEHLGILRSLSETTRARLAIGAVDLADQQQIDLTAARLEDRILSMKEAERTAAAQLRAAVGMEPGKETPTVEEPAPVGVPRSSQQELVQAALTHPSLESFELQAQSHEYTARSVAADRLPSFTIGADWILTGEARMADVADSGKDGIVVGAGVRVPLWQGSYSKSVEAAQAEAVASRSDGDAAANQAIAELEAALAQVRDSARRVELFRNALLPQAESTYTSVLGSYAAGRGSVAQALLAQRDLLELRIELEEERAAHARAWARLEQVTAENLGRADLEQADLEPSGTPPPAADESTKATP